jgi:hypothetical protein
MSSMVEVARTLDSTKTRLTRPAYMSPYVLEHRPVNGSVIRQSRDGITTDELERRAHSIAHERSVLIHRGT